MIFQVHDGNRTIATAPYLDARDIARLMSADTSGRYWVIPPAGSLVAAESFANGQSEG
jgi:hypothetical protein